MQTIKLSASGTTMLLQFASSVWFAKHHSMILFFMAISQNVGLQIMQNNSIQDYFNSICSYITQSCIMLLIWLNGKNILCISNAVFKLSKH